MFRNYWYAIELTRNVRRKPLGIRRFGEHFVLWRDATGAVVCFRDRCPHRGARLSKGKLLSNDCLQCPLHGFQYDRNGTCTRIPALGKAKKPTGALSLTAFTVLEEHGIVWLWLGESRTNLPPIPWFDELTEADLPYVELSRDTPVSFGRFMEGNLDFAHFEFVHKILSPRGAGPLAADIETQVDGDLVRISGVMRPDDGRSREQAPGVGFSGAVRFPGIATYEIPPNSKMFGLVAASPVDAESTWFVIRMTVPRGPLLALRKWAVNAVFLKIAFQKVQHPQDLRALEGQHPSSSGVGHDRLVSPMDGALVHYLKMWRRAAEAERDSETDADSPPDTRATQPKAAKLA